MSHAAYLVCFITLLLAAAIPTTAHSDGASHALPVTVQCPVVRTPKGTLVARYVQDHFPSGADACVAISGAGSKGGGLLQVVPFNFCPRGGHYLPRRNAADVCLVAARPGNHPARGKSAIRG